MLCVCVVCVCVRVCVFVCLKCPCVWSAEQFVVFHVRIQVKYTPDNLQIQFLVEAYKMHALFGFYLCTIPCTHSHKGRGMCTPPPPPPPPPPYRSIKKHFTRRVKLIIHDTKCHFKNCPIEATGKEKKKWITPKRFESYCAL